MSINTATLRSPAQSAGYLLSFALASGTQRLCTYGDIDVLGQSWRHADFSVHRKEEGLHGLSSITIELVDLDLAWANSLMAGFAPGVVCEFYEIRYGASDWETSLEFVGLMNRPRIRKNRTVEIQATLSDGHVAVLPRVPFDSDYSLPRGAERVINGTTYRIE